MFAPTEQELFARIRCVLQRCRQHGITISKKKLTMGQKVSFAGFSISKDGVQPSQKLVAAIKEMKSPTDLSTLRSFMGMVNQLGQFMPDLAHLTAPMRAAIKDEHCI